MVTPIEIKGATALITGANRGLGLALTEMLLTRGVKKVYATARNAVALPKFQDKRVVPLQLDVTNEAHIAAAVESAVDVELVFNNAGLALGTSILHPECIDQARREMEVNYFGPLRVIRAFAPLLAKNGGGGVVNIGSAAGLANVPFMPTYSTSKAALHSLTQATRCLLIPRGTSVFGVYAGPIDTDMARELAIPKTSAHNVASAILDGIEAGREDIFPDEFAASFGELFQSSPKAAEQQFSAMRL